MNKALIASAAFMALSVIPAEGRTLGYLQMCVTMRAECTRDGAKYVIVTSELLRELKRVNSEVNTAIKPRAEKGADVWLLAPEYGDCEDYALTKRSILRKMGVPTAAMWFGVVTAPTGELHAVLVVRTKTGALVLDNMTQDVLPLERTGYTLRELM